MSENSSNFTSKYDELYKLQKDVLDESDYYPIKDTETEEWSMGLGNAGCLKMAAELDLTDRIIDEKCVERDGGYMRYEFTVEIFDNAGRSLTQEVGSADTREKPNFSPHNLRGFAKTRAWQRGIKKAAKILDRLASDLTPKEKVRISELEKAEASARASAAAATAAAPQAADAPPGPEHAGPECECEAAKVTTPYKESDAYHCGTCKQPISRRKRVEFMTRQRA